MPRVRSATFTKPPVIQVVGGAGMSVLTPPVSIDPISATLAVVNSNPYLIGVFYLFLNLGGRFLSLELTKRQEWFLAQPIIRPFILFAVMFISTRNIAVAFWTTAGILSVLWVFANENSDFCLIPGWREKPAGNNYDNVMDILKRKLNKAFDVNDDGHIDEKHKEQQEEHKEQQEEHKDEHDDTHKDDNHESHELNNQVHHEEVKSEH
jgi:hypothetical protein